MVLGGFKKRTKINFNGKMGEYLKHRGSENQENVEMTKWKMKRRQRMKKKQ